MYKICGSDGNYTGDTTFLANLVGLLTSLSASAPATNFAMTASGETPNKVYGLALCRGDLDATDCGGCLAGRDRFSHFVSLKTKL